MTACATTYRLSPWNGQSERALMRLIIKLMLGTLVSSAIIPHAPSQTLK